MSQEAVGDLRLRRIRITLRASDRFPVPISDGYSVYGALLGALDDVDESVSEHVHDSALGSVHSSGLLGPFGDSDRQFHKTVLPGKEYELTLGVVDPDDAEIFQALVRAFVLDGDSLELSYGELRVESFESENATHEELLERGAGLDDPTIEMTFRTPTCIVEHGEVTTAFPYRWSVFNSLLGKWNRSCPGDLELELDRESVLASVIEKPDVRSYDTHSVLVNRVENEDGENRNLFRQGFTGDCVYEFKDASESVENVVTALGFFGAYSGVGSAVARGCGSVKVGVEKR
jgi:hypothetical protein